MSIAFACACANVSNYNSREAVAEQSDSIALSKIQSHKSNNIYTFPRSAKKEIINEISRRSSVNKKHVQRVLIEAKIHKFRNAHYFNFISRETEIEEISKRSEVSKENVKRILDAAKAYYSTKEDPDETGNPGPGIR